MEYFDLENPLTSFEEHQSDTIPSLFADESLHMPSLNVNVAPSFRRDAISLVSQVQFSYNLDPFVPYLAVNYLDRFLSTRDISQEKPWILRLIVISCLSLAAKMKNTNLPLSILQGDEGCVYDSRSINRMEVLILTTLNWRMRSITPFSFLRFFISSLELEDQSRLTEPIRNRASDILFKSQCEIKLLEHKPSIIAASAILCASNQLFPSLYHRFKTIVSSCEHGSLEGCLCVLQNSIKKAEEDGSIINAASTGTTATPLSVLECQCSSNIIKRRKLNEGSNDDDDQLFQLSQGQPC